MVDKRTLKKAKNLFFKLTTDPASVIFVEKLLDSKVIKKLKKSKYHVDK